MPPEPLQDFVQEIVATEPDLLDRATDQWGTGGLAFRVRRDDLVRCLALDGYTVSERRLIAIEPDLQGASHVEDALAAEIRRSTLPSTEDIVRLPDQSADAFRQVPPNYEACLTNVRVALQTLATEIAQVRQHQFSGTFQADKWGQVLIYLRMSGLVTKAGEDLASAVYTFISPGAHLPMKLSQEEMVRLGRRMAISACYFLVKLHNG